MLKLGHVLNDAVFNILHPNLIMDLSCYQTFKGRVY